MENKLYCYVDETGQDTGGKVFIVVIIIDTLKSIDAIEAMLLNAEIVSNKKRLKWKKVDNTRKKSFLEEIQKIKILQYDIFYGIYKSSKEYTRLTALTIARATLAKAQKNYSVSIVIDALNDVEKGIIRSELKRLKINYKKIKGLKDEQSAMLRLADAMAGFLRDAIIDEKNYMKKYLSKMRKNNLIHEI